MGSGSVGSGSGSAGAALATGAAGAASPGAAAVGGAGALTADGKLVLNEAQLEDFRRLPGVGEKRARALLELREKLGRFRRMSDLLRVKGIGPRSLKKFAEVAVVDRPAVGAP